MSGREREKGGERKSRLSGIFHRIACMLLLWHFFADAKDEAKNAHACINNILLLSLFSIEGVVSSSWHYGVCHFCKHGLSPHGFFFLHRIYIMTMHRARYKRAQHNNQ